MRSKQQYTNAFLANGDDSVPSTHANHFFWMNIRNEGGLRLTTSGYEYLKLILNLEYYEIETTDVKVTNQFLVDLDRLIKCPYYLSFTGYIPKSKKKVILFDKKVFFALTMYDNNFEKFLNAHKI